MSKKVPSEVLTSLSGIEEPGRLADTIAAHMSVDLEEKQRILEVASIRERLNHLLGSDGCRNRPLFKVEKRVRGRVKEANGEKPARVLFERADEGNPKRAGRHG